MTPAPKIAVDHLGITVPDLDEAIAFFVDVFGFDVVLQAGPYDDFGYVWPGNDGPEKASLQLAVLKLGETLAARDDIKVLAPVQVEGGGPLDGLIWSYSLTSFGVVIELIRWRPGLAYEATSTHHRLVPPPWLRDAVTP
ncbi:VOC family protein [Nonomuraea sp. B19D2]|uniref:VOC family protein n=1 Tax=Nonomuraea sp. B19D2 TaxID=3159561 RepID=UPI0032D9EEF5